MRTLYVAGLMAGIVFTLAASTRPSAAVIIYPWCVNSGGGKGAGSQSCGFTSRAQCELTRAGNGGFCVQSLLRAVSTAADICAAYPAMRWDRPCG